MKKFKSIAGILLLSIYSIVVLHNLIPHFHCESDSKIVGVESMHVMHNGIHHNHQHGHSEEAESENWLDSFLSLLGGLEHHELGEGHFENFTVQNQNFNISGPISSEIASCDITFIGTFVFKTIKKTGERFVNRLPIIPGHHYLCSSSLRGPPSLS